MTDLKFMSRDFKEELRQQNLRWENEVKAIRKSIEGIKSNIRNQTIVTLLGIAAMVIAVLLK